MAQDVVERMNQRAGEVLHSGERYFGAQPMTVKGRNSVESWAADADVMAMLPNYVAQHGTTEVLDVADDAVPSAFLAAVTEKRVLLFSRSITGKPKELVEEYDLASITLDVVDTGDKVRSRLFVFGRPSGKVFVGQCPINGKALSSANLFVDAWTEAESLSQN